MLLTTGRHCRLFGFLVVAVTGCDFPNTVCDASAAAGLAVTVIDATSRQMVQPGATVIAFNATTADTARVFGDSGVAFLLFERPGTYTVSVSAPAYMPWQQTNVRITSDRCHVRMARVTAELQPR